MEFLPLKLLQQLQSRPPFAQSRTFVYRSLTSRPSASSASDNAIISSTNHLLSNSHLQAAADSSF